MKTSRIQQCRLQTQFVEFHHCFHLHQSLVKHSRAVIFDDPENSAMILQFTPPTSFSDEQVFHLVSMQANNYRSQALIQGQLRCERSVRHVNFHRGWWSLGTEQFVKKLWEELSRSATGRPKIRMFCRQLLSKLTTFAFTWRLSAVRVTPMPSRSTTRWLKSSEVRGNIVVGHGLQLWAAFGWVWSRAD